MRLVSVYSYRNTCHSYVCSINPLNPPGKKIRYILFLGRHTVKLCQILKPDVGSVAKTNWINGRIDMQMTTIMVIIIPNSDYLFLCWWRTKYTVDYQCGSWSVIAFIACRNIDVSCDSLKRPGPNVHGIFNISCTIVPVIAYLDTGPCIINSCITYSPVNRERRT